MSEILTEVPRKIPERKFEGRPREDSEERIFTNYKELPERSERTRWTPTRGFWCYFSCLILVFELACHCDRVKSARQVSSSTGEV
jgi:hypothetical protein